MHGLLLCQVGRLSENQEEREREVQELKSQLHKANKTKYQVACH